MIVVDKEKKKLYLEKVFGKFLIKSLEETSPSDYEIIFNNYEFIQTYDNIVFYVEFKKPRMSNIMYYPTKLDFPPEINEEVYTDYILKKMKVYKRPLWIERRKECFYLVPKKTRNTIREINTLEFKEITELFEKHKENMKKLIKLKYARDGATLSCFALWE